MSAPAHAPSHIGLFLKVYAALMILLLVTVGAAYVPMGPFNIVVTLIIATVKAWLVVLFFMHLNHGALLTRLIAIGSLIWLAILMAGLLMDYATSSVTRFPQTLSF